MLQQEDKKIKRRFNLRLYFRQQPVIFAVLTVLAIVFFLIVTGLSRMYQSQRQALGNRWFTRGVAELNARNYLPAISDFRAALLYSRDNYSYQLNLAEALIGEGHTGEASAYLLNLWDREPDNGLVNLELARIAANQGKTKEAIRYYHDAVYAAWPSDQDENRHQARLELIQLLLRIHAYTDAQSELIALSENIGDEPKREELIGELFVQAQDYEHALGAFRITLRTDRHNQAALAGAGNAAFQLQRYQIAERYLQEAVAENPKDTQSASLLKTTELVLHLDPFQRQISASERSRRVMDAFDIAGQRLKKCPVQGNGVHPGGGVSSLNDEWNAMKPKITPRELRGNPELVDSAMDLVFRIERQSTLVCGTPTGEDLALALIAKSREGT
ncbi:MAG TPA: tetratricopeptide repeat protein [Candidatus Sulfotelmatobacter sp.]|nr:tetratricopeptide repeat protein [Candidatus Sulfotelmatobacter sp.]